jgi:cytochrome bd ubiquinol oxidase subunit II
MMPTVAYIIVVSLFAIYAMLDGFDLGIGIIQPLSFDHNERKILQKAISPVWNGNEVWLITAGGALFAAFPSVYATLASAMYLPVIMLLISFIFRAISLEARETFPMHWWQHGCDIAFTIASFLITLIFGVALGNLIQGIPLQSSQEYTGSLFSLFHPFCLLTGMLGVSLFAMHGVFFSLLKTENDLHSKIAKLARPILTIFIILFGLTILSAFTLTSIDSNMIHRPFVWTILLIIFLSIAWIYASVKKEQDLSAFAASSCTIISLFALYAAASFPTLIHSSANPEQWSLTIQNSAASALSLKVFLIYILIGIPCVVGYSSFVYWTFRGKVRHDEGGY